MDTRQRQISDPTTGDTGADHLLDTAFAFWRASLLLIAEEIGLFAALAHGPSDASTLSTRLGLDPAMATDLPRWTRGPRATHREALAPRHRNTAHITRFPDPAQPFLHRQPARRGAGAQRDMAR